MEAERVVGNLVARHLAKFEPELTTSACKT